MENKSIQTTKKRFQTQRILKTNLCRLWKLPLKYLWMRVRRRKRKSLEEYHIDDEKIDWNRNKSFFLPFFLCVYVVAAASESIGGWAQKTNGMEICGKSSTDNGIIYYAALDSNERWNIYYTLEFRSHFTSHPQLSNPPSDSSCDSSDKCHRTLGEKALRIINHDELSTMRYPIF